MSRYKLPVMQCDDGCGKCCGPVLCQDHEYKRVVGFAANRGIEPVRQGMTCPWFQDGRCQVYDARPHACRLFGHCEGMVCCKGYNVNVPEKIVSRIMRDYLAAGQVDRMLHEACYSLDEIQELHTDYLAKLT